MPPLTAGRSWGLGERPLGALGAWDSVHNQICHLEATFINMLRCKLPPGAPLKDALQQPQLLQEAADEAKQALRQGHEKASKLCQSQAC